MIDFIVSYLKKISTPTKIDLMPKIIFQAIFFAGLSYLLISWDNHAEHKKKPVNIIYIMADDMGYGDLSSFGRKDYQTKVLDAFIREGVKFNNAYAAAPVCTPTRVAFMTGRYPARNETGLMEPLRMNSVDIDMGLSPATPSLSSLLKGAGYETALFGKWHLGFKPEFFPGKHGFDHFFGITSGAADYVDHKNMRNMPVLFENNTAVEKPGYLTDLITDYTVEFIKKKHQKPFFISLQYTSPHWPWQAPGDPAYPDSLNFRTGGNAETYAKMVLSMDENIGRVLKAVKDAGLDENTLIIFTSDNGGERYSNMGSFKGRKMELLEGGIRVPAGARWPGVIPANTESNQPVITMDWTATILDVAGVKPPASISLDGISVLPLVKAKSAIVPRDFYWRTSIEQKADAFRSGDWKYLKNKDGEYLFDLSKDPYETTNLKESQPEKFKQVKDAFLRLDNQMLKPYFYPEGVSG